MSNALQEGCVHWQMTCRVALLIREASCHGVTGAQGTLTLAPVQSLWLIPAGPSVKSCPVSLLAVVLGTPAQARDCLSPGSQGCACALGTGQHCERMTAQKCAVNGRATLLLCRKMTSWGVL